MLQDYLFPETVNEAVSFLQEHEGQARIIAGGTDLMLDIPEGKIETNYLVDISRIPELREITMKDDLIYIGAAVTHNQVASSELIQKNAAALAQAAGYVGYIKLGMRGLWWATSVMPSLPPMLQWRWWRWGQRRK
ncbi:MAG: FAD binding domain-containing protein [Candidatus Syntrophopropionicum ammoniitolerans]